MANNATSMVSMASAANKKTKDKIPNQGLMKTLVRKGFLLFFFLAVFILMNLIGNVKPVMAATSPGNAEVQQNTFEYLKLGQGNSNTAIGRYSLNYTGNINVYAAPSPGFDDETYRSQVLPGWSNSSMGTLYGNLYSDNNKTHIVKAYLVWETRKKYSEWDESTNHVSFIMHDRSTYYNIYPDKVYIDDRSTPYVSGWEQTRPRIYCNVADVTSIVKAYGYGDYYVANIPVCRASDLYDLDTGGGGTPTGWQLIVVEENDSYPVRAVALGMGSKFRFGDYDWERNDNGTDEITRAMVSLQVSLNNGLKTKASGNVTGQILFGGIDSAHNTNTKTIYAYSQNSLGTETQVGGSTIQEGLYRDGSLFCPETDMGSVLYNINGLGKGDSTFGTKVYNVRWNTQLYIGAAVDIAFPDFESQQTTTIENGKVVVRGVITNVSSEYDTGIYDGRYDVILDPNLSIENFKIGVNGNYSANVANAQGTETDANGKIHPKITFYGGGVSSFFKGDKIDYEIVCTINGSGMTRFDNSDCFNGYLRSSGSNTGYWIDKAWYSTSWCNATFHVNTISGTGIQNVSGAGDYTVGQNVTVNATVSTGYHWKNWTGTYGTTTKQYTFTMPAQNVTLTANAEINYSVLKVNPNGGMWNGSSNVQSFSQAYGTTKSIPDPVKTGYTFTEWAKSNPFYGKLVNKIYTYGATLNATDVLTAKWQANQYRLTFDPNGGGFSATQVTQVTLTFGTSDYSDVSWNTPYLKGYTFLGWYSEKDGGVQVYNENGLCTNEGTYWKNNKCCYAGNYTVYAHWQANEYTFYFDPNGGAGTDIPSVTVHYDEVYSFPNGSDNYKKYTLDGVNITTDVINGTIDLDNENVTDPANDPQALQRAYASVYLGWGLESDKMGFTPRWNAYETTSVASIVEAAGVADANGGSVTLYAIWDDCPWILASDRYFTLNEAHNGVITEEEMFKTAKATDTEDGDIPPGENFILIDFDENELLELPCEATLRIIYQSTDSQGSIYKKSVYIHVVDDLVNPDDPDDPATSAKYQSWVYPRFINAQFFQNADGSLVPEEKGGVVENSVWRTDSAKTALLSETLKAERTGQEVRNVQIGTGSFDVTVAGSGSWTSVQNIWEFTPEDVERSKEFVKNHGWANYVEADGLAKWLQEFDDCKKK